MPLRNDRNDYGSVALLLHWSLALLIIGLFLLGKYMVGLDYYHPWYQKAPDLHRSLGMVVALLLLVRLLWRLVNEQPRLLGKRWERLVALWVHRLFYLLIASVVVSGYLITTAKGQPVEVFGWFEVPALFPGLAKQEDMAGDVHELLANLLILLALLHGLAALKHHFIDRDPTLLRMLAPGSVRPVSNPADNPEE